MSTKYKKAIIIAATSLSLILLSYVIFNVKYKEQVENPPIVHDTTPPKKELEDWQIEAQNEVLSKPAKKLHTKVGDFFYTANPKQFPRSEVADLDLNPEAPLTKNTKLIIHRHYFYEKR